MHRCLQRHGISRLPEVEGDKPTKQKFGRYPIGYFHIDIAEVRALGVVVGYGTAWRFLASQGLSVKKTALASEQGRPDVARARAL